MAFTKLYEYKGLRSRYVQGEIRILFSASLEPGDDRTEISDEEAMKLLEEQKGHLASSNDGSNLIADAQIVLFED